MKTTRLDRVAAIQDFYPDDFSHCFGCGRLNEHGHQIKSRDEGDAVVLHFEPAPYHLSMPGFTYGGLIASLIDCHSMATAAAATYRAEGREPGTQPPLRFVTAHLGVDYLEPTPLGPLDIRAQAPEVGPRKVRVEVDVRAAGRITVRGDVLAVRIPETMRTA